MGLMEKVEHAPTENGHTTYYLFLQKDNIVKPFPLFNFLQCRKEHKDKTEVRLKEMGLQLVLDNFR